MAHRYTATCYSVVFWSLFVSVAGVKWDGLKATWRLDPFDTYFFDTLPRTVIDALRERFVKIDDCDGNATWRGFRYQKNNDPALLLLYDVNGFIAGMQTTVPTNLKSGYPGISQVPPFVRDEEDRYVITVYFVDPAIICTFGRTYSDFNNDGTGTDLYVQNGTIPEKNSFIIPRREANIINTIWRTGKCFPTMGKHYWYNISFDMSCHDFFPVFPLYNNGELTAFGFILWANLPSPRYEQPPASVYKHFFFSVPECAYFASKVSAMHVFLTSRVGANLC